MSDGREPWRQFAALIPAWQAPPGVHAFVTGRAGGQSVGAWGLHGDAAGGLNLGARCGDEPAAVKANRRRLAAALPAMPVWLNQVHGTGVRVVGTQPGSGADDEPQADAAVTDLPGVVLAVLTADCLPVFIADCEGRAIGVAHAGWRGLAAGVLENTVAALRERLAPGARLQASLGPAIGPAAFEVGPEVREAFCDQDACASAAFQRGRRHDRWQANLYQLATLRLHRCGVLSVSGGGCCTWSDPTRFWSYRRHKHSGRMASVIWIEGPPQPANAGKSR